LLIILSSFGLYILIPYPSILTYVGFLMDCYFLEKEIKGLFCGGDDAGVTRGLAQAGSGGVWVAKSIMERM
jgi:hypothetical protein